MVGNDPSFRMKTAIDDLLRANRESEVFLRFVTAILQSVEYDFPSSSVAERNKKFSEFTRMAPAKRASITSSGDQEYSIFEIVKDDTKEGLFGITTFIMVSVLSKRLLDDKPAKHCQGPVEWLGSADRSKKVIKEVWDTYSMLDDGDQGRKEWQNRIEMRSDLWLTGWGLLTTVLDESIEQGDPELFARASADYLARRRRIMRFGDWTAGNPVVVDRSQLELLSSVSHYLFSSIV